MLDMFYTDQKDIFDYINKIAILVAKNIYYGLYKMQK